MHRDDCSNEMIDYASWRSGETEKTPPHTESIQPHTESTTLRIFTQWDLRVLLNTWKRRTSLRRSSSCAMRCSKRRKTRKHFGVRLSKLESREEHQESSFSNLTIFFTSGSGSGHLGRAQWSIRFLVTLSYVIIWRGVERSLLSTSRVRSCACVWPPCACVGPRPLGLWEQKHWPLGEDFALCACRRPDFWANAGGIAT